VPEATILIVAVLAKSRVLGQVVAGADERPNRSVGLDFEGDDLLSLGDRDLYGGVYLLAVALVGQFVVGAHRTADLLLIREAIRSAAEQQLFINHSHYGIRSEIWRPTEVRHPAVELSSPLKVAIQVQIVAPGVLHLVDVQ